ncbi:diguanylate cyclase (GGDEF) domain-containing protein [Butyrivibrio proteoclasticus]|uniref:Diguanylate cyclase (GGDEF) domain-containing protein n=1 Tax=Butyrivibrio proteoclasticus TaxID=43305 RepID=A0A1I5UR86_9FIRM|nr:GGDEF domain-containing protein [Butyrivibrio proteoclasticus]SFP97793.1 diguanylate cyclase (GGDEF) domain-containing protein [Butyrivibrio proteoclasticus]
MNIKNFDSEIQALYDEVLTTRTSMSSSYISACNRFIRKAKEADDQNLLGYAYYYLADSYYLLTTDYRKFNHNLLKAIEILQTCGENEYLARCYNLLGIDALNHGNYELALDFFLSGKRQCEDLDSNVTGFIDFNIGQIYYTAGDPKQALTYIRSAYKQIRKNKKDSLYYRNVLFCYCFEADCYMELEKPDSVKKCLLGIDKLEEKNKDSKEFTNGITATDIRTRGYHYLGDMVKFQRYALMLLKIIQNNKHPLDNIEDIFIMCRFFIKIGWIDEAVRIVDNTERSLADFNIAHLKKDFAKLKCELYACLGNKKKKNEALNEFFQASNDEEKERLANYKFFTDIRNRLHAIEKENVILQKQASTDPLTGLGNRYGLNKFADAAFEKAFELKRSLAVEFLDIDNFKQYNDTYGHQAGDECLTKVASIINEMARENELIHAFRYGGDEFVIIYESMTDKEVMEYATMLRQAVLNLGLSSRYSDKKIVTISQGIRNSVPQETTKLWDYMYAADNALYQVKEHTKGEIIMLHKAVISQKSLDDATHL